MTYEELMALMNDPAIANLDFLRQLIAETRGQDNYADMARLRMVQGTGMGTDALSTERGDE